LERQGRIESEGEKGRKEKGRKGEREKGRMGEWENGRVGDWENGDWEIRELRDIWKRP
jgi:hypothetical protein